MTDNQSNGEIRVADAWLDSLNTTYRQHRRGLLALAVTVTGCPDRAEDAVHDAFARLCKRPRAVDGELAAYVYRAVRNAAIDSGRRKQREVGPSLFEPVSRRPQPSEHAGVMEEQDRLMQAVDNLSDEARQIVILRAFAGLTFEQICEVNGDPRSTTYSKYHRALDRLREMLEETPLPSRGTA